MPRLRVHSLVEAEFNEASAWYADRSPLAAENFRARFGRALTRIDSRPTANAHWHNSPFRRVRLSHFPYLILYHTTRPLTSVLALAHERREPKVVLKTILRRLDRFA